MTDQFRARLIFCLSLCGLLADIGMSSGQAPRDKDEAKDKKPTLSVKATPTISFSPSRVIATAEIRGGADDYEEYYCAGAEWDWGDGTRSEASYDCEPYQAGRSEMRRRFAGEHMFTGAGSFRIQFRLKRRAKVLAAAHATVQVRPGFRDSWRPIGPSDDRVVTR
jgi:hypothetical protein